MHFPIIKPQWKLNFLYEFIALHANQRTTKRGYIKANRQRKKNLFIYLCRYTQWANIYIHTYIMECWLHIYKPHKLSVFFWSDFVCFLVLYFGIEIWLFFCSFRYSNHDSWIVLHLLSYAYRIWTIRKQFSFGKILFTFESNIFHAKCKFSIPFAMFAWWFMALKCSVQRILW